MANLKLNLNLSDKSSATLVRDYKLSAASNLKHEVIEGLENLLSSLDSGNQSCTLNLSVVENGTRASGTVTCASAQAADTVTINGVVLTAVSGTPAANQFDISGTDTQAATSLASAINTSVTALVTGVVTATSALGVVTIKSVNYDATGNLITLASSNNSRLAVSGARLTGGSADSTNYSF